MEDKSNQQAENHTTETEQTTEPHGTDWKAEARKWEARAKENSAAAIELQKLKEAQMTEAERMQKRAEDAEARVKLLESEAEIAQLAQDYAEREGVPLKLLKLCQDEESMHTLCDEWKAQAASLPQVHAGTTATPSKLVKPEASKRGAAGALADFFSEKFNG